MLTHQEIEQARNEVMRFVDHIFSELLLKVAHTTEPTKTPILEDFETVYPLKVPPVTFKGKKPTAVIIGDKRIEVGSWKAVIGEILKSCNKNAEINAALMNLRGRILGSRRILLANSGEGMHSPIKIDENLYVETNYDTETNIRILTQRILDVIGYDYSAISIVTRTVT